MAKLGVAVASISALLGCFGVQAFIPQVSTRFQPCNHHIAPYRADTLPVIILSRHRRWSWPDMADLVRAPLPGEREGLVSVREAVTLLSRHISFKFVVLIHCFLLRRSIERTLA